MPVPQLTLAALLTATLLQPLCAQDAPRENPRADAPRPRGERGEQPPGRVGEPGNPHEREAGRNPGGPQGNEPERRLQHLMIAAENLRAAGMNELADNITREAENMKRQLQKAHGEPGGERQPQDAPRGERGDKAFQRDARTAPQPGVPGAFRGAPPEGRGSRGPEAPQPTSPELQNMARQMMEMQQAIMELRRQLDEKKK